MLEILFLLLDLDSGSYMHCLIMVRILVNFGLSPQKSECPLFSFFWVKLYELVATVVFLNFEAICLGRIGGWEL